MFAVLGFRGQSTAVRFASLYGGGRSQLRCLGWYNKVGRPFFFPLWGFFGCRFGEVAAIVSGVCLQAHVSMAGERQCVKGSAQSINQRK